MMMAACNARFWVGSRRPLLCVRTTGMAAHLPRILIGSGLAQGKTLVRPRRDWTDHLAKVLDPKGCAMAILEATRLWRRGSRSEGPSSGPRCYPKEYIYTSELPRVLGSCSVAPRVPKALLPLIPYDLSFSLWFKRAWILLRLAANDLNRGFDVWRFSLRKIFHSVPSNGQGFHEMFK